MVTSTGQFTTRRADLYKSGLLAETEPQFRSSFLRKLSTLQLSQPSRDNADPLQLAQILYFPAHPRGPDHNQHRVPFLANPLVVDLKDEMVHVAEPANLSEYRKEVLRIDNRYWRREEERKRESNCTTPQSKPNSSAKKGNSSASTSVSVNVTPTSGNQSSENQNRKGGNRSNKGGAGQSSGQSPKSSNNSASRPPRPHERFLGPDGKLKPEELERRRKFNLCLFCGEKHKFEDCNKRKQSNQPRGRAAATQEPTSELPAIAEVPEN